MVCLWSLIFRNLKVYAFLPLLIEKPLRKFLQLYIRFQSKDIKTFVFLKPDIDYFKITMLEYFLVPLTSSYTFNFIINTSRFPCRVKKVMFSHIRKF